MALRTDVPIGRPALIDREARRGHLLAQDAAKLAHPLVPVVLIPTPAQKARGERVIAAADDQCPPSLLRLRAACEAAGWRWQTGYSHVLHPPKRGGEDWREVHHVTLRVFHEQWHWCGYGSWANGAWDGGQLGAVVECADGLRVDLATLRGRDAGEFDSIIKTGAVPVIARYTCPICAKMDLRLKADGTLYAHKWAGAPCPGTTGVRQ